MSEMGTGYRMGIKEGRKERVSMGIRKERRDGMGIMEGKKEKN